MNKISAHFLYSQAWFAIENSISVGTLTDFMITGPNAIRMKKRWFEIESIHIRLLYYIMYVDH